MLRFIAVTAIAVLLLAVALRSHGGASDSSGAPVPGVIRSQETPDVTVVDGNVTVRHRFAGSVSRASLVYDMDGEERTLAVTTACRRAIDGDSKVKGDSYAPEVELAGHLPKGAQRLRLVLEAETGTTILAVPLDSGLE